MILRTRVHVLMVFKLTESTQARWRAMNALLLAALLLAGTWFEAGELVERPGSDAVA